jgi:hypothetical protein
MKKKPTRETIFRIFAILFVAAAFYHGIGYFFPKLVVPSPHWRHGVFILVNLIGVWLILWRPPWAILPFAALTVQQLNGHIKRGLHWWTAHQRIDWLSIGVVIILPIALFLLIQEIKEKKQQKGNI